MINRIFWSSEVLHFSGSTHLKMKALLSFKTSDTLTQTNIPQDHNPQHQHCSYMNLALNKSLRYNRDQISCKLLVPVREEKHYARKCFLCRRVHCHRAQLANNMVTTTETSNLTFEFPLISTIHLPFAC